MNCAEVKERLSAFYDAELSSDESAQVADHLDVCPDCAQQRSVIQALSAGIRQLDVAVPPAEIWLQIEEQLNGRSDAVPVKLTHQKVEVTKPRWTRFHVLRPAFALAALVLIAIGLLTYQTWFELGGASVLAADLARYADEFPRNPDAAQQILLAKYDGREINLSDAAQRVGFRPAVAEGMPDQYSLDSVYVLKMPCCDCLQTICQRSDGSKFAIFEHGDEQRVTFGDRPESETECNGTNCRMVEINDQFAVNWQQDGRHISVVGVHDQAELERLVAWLN